MGISLEVDIPPLDVAFMVAVERAMLAGGRLILETAAAGAPFEDQPRHGMHLRETGYVRIAGDEGDLFVVEIGFTAFWALWQHENLDWHHEQGHAKFLELALVEMARPALELVAAELRGALGA